jgi:hypothetical protein
MRGASIGYRLIPFPDPVDYYGKENPLESSFSYFSDSQNVKKQRAITNLGS